MIEFTQVTGKKKGDIHLYALSTCIWCRKTRELLESIGVAFDYVYIDFLKGDERDAAMMELKRWNPSCSFPTLVLNQKECIVGFKEDRIRDVLEG